jgi:predicted nucleotidyltransferase
MVNFNFLFLIIVNELKNHIDRIKHLCGLYNVKSLFAFGSIVRDDFTSESDIDLVVDIDESDPIEYSENYFSLKFNLQDIFNRPIDLLEERALKNPSLKQQIDNTKVFVYGR